MINESRRLYKKWITLRQTTGTQAHTAAITGYSIRTIQALDQGKRRVTRRHLNALIGGQQKGDTK